MFYKITWSSDNGESITLDLQPCFPYTILLNTVHFMMGPNKSPIILWSLIVTHDEVTVLCNIQSVDPNQEKGNSLMGVSKLSSRVYFLFYTVLALHGSEMN